MVAQHAPQGHRSGHLWHERAPAATRAAGARARRLGNSCTVEPGISPAFRRATPARPRFDYALAKPLAAPLGIGATAVF